MSSKTTGIIIVLIIIIAGVFLMTKKSPETAYTGSMLPASAQGGDSNKGTNTNQVAAKDTSDSALTADAAAIDAQMNGFNSDTAAAASAQ